MSNAAQLFQDRLSEHDPTCMHCWIISALEAFAIADGQQVDNALHLNGDQVLAALAAVMSGLLSSASPKVRVELLAAVTARLNESLELRTLN